MRKPVRQRNEEQRERQRAYRERLKAERRPGRDDVARVLFCTSSSPRMPAADRKGRLDALQDVIVGRLVEQGFNERASHAVFDDLVERYTKEGWGFRRKAHLDPEDGAGRPRRRGSTTKTIGTRIERGPASHGEGDLVACRMRPSLARRRRLIHLGLRPCICVDIGLSAACLGANAVCAFPSRFPPLLR